MSDGNKATEIEERLIDFAVRVIKVADALPKTPVGNTCREVVAVGNLTDAELR